MNPQFNVVASDSLPLEQDDYFGLCPFTKTTDGYVNVGKEHFGYSKIRNTYWLIGNNLFSSWHDETEQHWDRNSAMLGAMRFVEPFYPDVPQASTSDTKSRRPWVSA